MRQFLLHRFCHSSIVRLFFFVFVRSSLQDLLSSFPVSFCHLFCHLFCHRIHIFHNTVLSNDTRTRHYGVDSDAFDATAATGVKLAASLAPAADAAVGWLT